MRIIESIKLLFDDKYKLQRYRNPPVPISGNVARLTFWEKHIMSSSSFDLRTKRLGVLVHYLTTETLSFRVDNLSIELISPVVQLTGLLAD